MMTLGIRRPVLDRFGLVLLLVLFSIVTLSLVDVHGSYVGQFVTQAVSGAALVVATRASGARLRARRGMDVFVLLSVVSSLFIAITGVVSMRAPESSIRPDILWTLAAVITPALIARRLVRHEVVTTQTVIGAVAAYLQIAVAYALLFQTIDGLTAGPFFGTDQPTTTYMYVSLSTIATLGYGDIVPVTDLGRLTAMSEAVIGQVYLVTFVAMIVSRFAAAPPGSRFPRRQHYEADGAGADDATE